jgi:two-component system, chemotaxis family, chemotaxis protein CheY
MALSSKKILLVDDSSFSRSVLKRILGDGYQYLEATNGLAGIEMFMLERPVLVILDLTMPDMNGMEVLEKIRQVDSSAHILVGSADIQSLTQQEVLSKGASGFIAKPFNPAQLQPLVQALLGSEV